VNDVVQQQISARVLPPSERGNETPRLISTGPIWDTFKGRVCFCIHGELLTLTCGFCDAYFQPRDEVSPLLAALDSDPLSPAEVRRLLGAIFQGEPLTGHPSPQGTPEIPPETPGIMHEVLSSLPLRSRIVIRLLLRGKSAAEIGSAIGQSKDRNIPISGARVGQLAAQATRKLRHPSRIQRVVASLPKRERSEFLDLRSKAKKSRSA